MFAVVDLLFGVSFENNLRIQLPLLYDRFDSPTRNGKWQREVIQDRLAFHEEIRYIQLEKKPNADLKALTNSFSYIWKRNLILPYLNRIVFFFLGLRVVYHFFFSYMGCF